MSKTNVNTEDKNNVEPSWDAAISDAQQRIKDFRAAIKVYRNAKKRGDTWPGSDGYTVTQEL